MSFVNRLAKSYSASRMNEYQRLSANLIGGYRQIADACFSNEKMCKLCRKHSELELPLKRDLEGKMCPTEKTRVSGDLPEDTKLTLRKLRGRAHSGTQG